MASIDEQHLPDDILEKIRELELELSEGDITEKGFYKKRNALLQKYQKELKSGQNSSDKSENHVDSNSSNNIAQSNRRKDGRKYTRDESRYRSDVHEEAVREALARHKGQEALAPSKRRDQVVSCELKLESTSISIVPNRNIGIIANNNLSTVNDSDTEDDEIDDDADCSENGAADELYNDEDCDNITNASSDSSNKRKNNRSNEKNSSANSLTQIITSSSNQHKSPRVSRREAAGNFNKSYSNNVNPRPQPRQRTQNNDTNGTNNNINPSHRSNQFFQAGSHGAPPDVTNHVAAQQHSVIQQLNQQQQQQQQHDSYNNNNRFSHPQVSTQVRDDVLINTTCSHTDSLSSLSTQQPQSVTQYITTSQPQQQQAPTPQLPLATTTTATTTTTVSSNSSLPPPSDNGVVSSRVSQKIQQLVQTLKRPKKRPLLEYFQDNEEAVPQPCQDPNAPKPKGSIIEVAVGEPVKMMSCHHRSLELALEYYAQNHGKQPVMTCVDNNGRISGTSLTYAKLHQKAMKVAYLLLNKVGHRGEQSLKPRDRVALVFSNNDPCNLICAFYGCLLASVVPLTIEVPLASRDASCQSMGFLLSQHDIRVVLTSEQCYKTLPRRSSNGEIDSLSGWPQVQWINIDHHTTTIARDWKLPDRLEDHETLYIEYAFSARDASSVRGVCVSRKSTMQHCLTLASICRYEEGDTLVCVSELKRETGLWHGLLTSVLMGLHVVFVPYAVLKVDPTIWLKQIHKYKAPVALVKSRDMHWAYLSDVELQSNTNNCNTNQSNASLACVRVLLVSDGSNPWSLSTLDAFVRRFRQRGFNPDAVCPVACSSETLTLSMRRPGQSSITSAMTVDIDNNLDKSGSSSSAAPGGRGILNLISLSHNLVRVDNENSVSILGLQDCGQIFPGTKAVAIKLSGPPHICHTDEVGEICIQATYVATGYYQLAGQTNNYFHVQPIDPSTDQPIDPDGPGYVRSGLLGFLGPAKSGGMIFVCGTVSGLMQVSGRRHNADDIIATVLAVQPTRLVFRGRITAFSIPMLRDERIVVVAELRAGFNEEAAFKWMSRVLQAIDTIHKVHIYAIVLVPPNRLPKTALGGIHVAETRRRLIAGCLGACSVLLCPHGAITNLPQPRQQPSVRAGPSAMMVGRLVQGIRPAQAQGRPAVNALVMNASGNNTSHSSNSSSSTTTTNNPAAAIGNDLLSGGQHQPTISFILLERANSHPQSRLFTQLDYRLQDSSVLTCLSLQRRAERIASCIVDKKKLPPKTPILLIYPPGTDLICAVYACLMCGCIPVPVKPPPTAGAGIGSGNTSGNNSSGYVSSNNSTIASNALHLVPSSATIIESIIASLDFIRQVMQITHATTVLTSSSVLKSLKSRYLTSQLNVSMPPTEWQTIIDTDDLPKRRLSPEDFYRPASLDEIAYYDFSLSNGSASTSSSSSTALANNNNNVNNNNLNSSAGNNVVGIAQSHSALLQICQAQKLQCEFYPSREVVLSLDPYSGLGFTLWCLAGVYCGHMSYLVPSNLLDNQPDLWLAACSIKQVRDTFCSYNTVECSTNRLANSIPQLKQRGIQLNCLRSLVIVAEERPRVNTTNNFCKLFSVLGLNPRAVSTSFGCRVNVAMCLQGPSSPETSSVYVDQISLRNDRVQLVEKGSPYSLCLQDSGKILPGVQIAIANPDTQGQCSDSHLGEIWVSSPFNSSQILLNSSSSTSTTANDQLNQRLACGETDAVFARTGYLGFVRRTELTQSDGERHDALFVVGALEDTIILRGMRYHPIDIETTVIRSNKSKIVESVVFTWSNLLVVVVELNGEEWEAIDLVHLVTAAVLEEHHLIVGVVVVVDRGTVHISSRGEKERVLLRELFVNDKLDPMYVSYNM